MFSKNPTSKGKTTELDRMIESWRRVESSEESLSQACRARILAGTSGKTSTDAARPHRLFHPTRLMAWALVVPALLLAVTLAWQLMPGAPLDATGDQPRISAIKRGNEVIFVIANGEANHKVYRSESLSGAVQGEEPFAVTDSSFRDRLDSGADLVFYRID